jgi:hypothetical protein
MTRALRFIAGLLAGCASAVGIASLGFALLRAAWPEYSEAEPDKAYTLAMLLARLSVAATLTMGAACAATLVAGDNGRAAVSLGAFFVAVSLPSHLYYVWDDYPVWYHFVYLLSLVPIAWLGSRLLRTVMPLNQPATEYPVQEAV